MWRYLLPLLLLAAPAQAHCYKFWYYHGHQPGCGVQRVQYHAQVRSIRYPTKPSPAATVTPALFTIPPDTPEQKLRMKMIMDLTGGWRYP